MNKLEKLIKSFLDRIPRVLFLSKRSRLSVLNILKGYNHSNSLRTNYKYKSDEEIIPWMTYPFLDYIKNLDLTDKKIFEYGSGFSTVFWAKNAKHVVSVEDYELWFDKMNKMMPENSALILRTDKDKFIESINESEKEYDIIVLDGNGFRYECALASIDKLASGGMIVLDDADNIFYKRICDFLKENNLIQVDFVGLKPFSHRILSTSIFIKRDFNLKQKYEEVQPKVFVGEQRNYEA